MTRRLTPLVVVLGVLAIVPLASAAYPAPFAAQGGEGLLSKDGQVRFVAVGIGGGQSTVINAIDRAEGSTLKKLTLSGSFGVPQVTYRGPAGGLFRDGSAFVLQSTGYGATTRFVVVGARELDVRSTIELKGAYAFDALSPDASRMYLIQHSSANDLEHYVVRAYDLNAQKLLPGRIADKTQRSWVMQGWPVSRKESADGRWAYTLYANPGGYPFIHALDTVAGTAHCIGIPWRASDGTQSVVFNLVLRLKGRSLAVGPAGARAYRLVNTTTWKVTKPKQ
jgi:hypothetical protein